MYQNSFEDILIQELAVLTGLSSLTTRPAPGLAVLLQGFSGKPRRPWDFANSRYVSAGGLWSTREDLMAFLLRYVTSHDVSADPGWHAQGEERYLCNGSTRDSIAVAIYDRRASALALSHSMAHTMTYTLRLAEENILKALHRGA